MTAGWIENKFYRYIATPQTKQKILKQAIHNLKHNYYYFGLLEEREKSIDLCQKKFNWHSYQNIAPQKKTHKRAKVNDVDAETLQAIKSGNDLDIEFYDFAREYFKTL